jgi:hypothetical protein
MLSSTESVSLDIQCDCSSWVREELGGLYVLSLI